MKTTKPQTKMKSLNGIICLRCWKEMGNEDPLNKQIKTKVEETERKLIDARSEGHNSISINQIREILKEQFKEFLE